MCISSQVATIWQMLMQSFLTISLKRFLWKWKILEPEKYASLCYKTWYFLGPSILNKLLSSLCEEIRRAENILSKKTRSDTHNYSFLILRVSSSYLQKGNGIGLFEDFDAELYESRGFCQFRSASANLLLVHMFLQSQKPFNTFNFACQNWISIEWEGIWR